MNKRLQVAKYVLADICSAAIAWALFFAFRKVYIESKEFVFEPALYRGLVFIPMFWLLLYTATGAYKNIYRKYRLKEFGQTLMISLIGVIILFFTLLLDDDILFYWNYYYTFFGLLGIHFFTTYLFRFFLTSNTVWKIHNRMIGFNTLIIGGNERALNVYKEIEGLKRSPGYNFVGFLSVNGADRLLAETDLKHFGKFNGIIEQIISDHNIKEVIVAVESSEHEYIGHIINELEGRDLNIKVIPDMYDILSGSVKMNNIMGEPLIEINSQIVPSWQMTIKRLIDIFASLFAILVLSPIFIILGILVKSSSKGPIIFSQERIGRHGEPFYIYKFRTMYIDAEAGGPQLSSQNDSRITKTGVFLRRTRLDEFPQFFNVLKGDMSLVGPRPERQHFIDLIMKEAPHYRHLHKVRPGITSWGQVKYGYAENVDQMIARLKYDILYIENMTLAIDFKIMIYTVLIVLKGTGK
jgi:exopolysaccharide biosynthesis polyprenyl glycosylphosphotransferase